MKRGLQYAFFLALFSLLFYGCGPQTASTKQAPITPDSDLPDWVLNPYVEDGLAATMCVNWSGNMSLDNQEASANARAELARQINVTAKVMDKSYGKKISMDGGAKSSSIFSTVSKQVAQAKLVGSRPVKVKRVMIDGEKKLCVMMTMTKKKLFEDIIKAAEENSGEQIDPKMEEEMYLEFKQFKDMQEMEAELQKTQ